MRNLILAFCSTLFLSALSYGAVNDSIRIRKLLEKADILQKNLQQDSQLIYLNQALKITQKSKRKLDEAMVLRKIGEAYSSISKYGKSLSYYFKSLGYYEQLKNYDGVINALTDIGVTYDNWQNTPKSLEYFQKAYKLALEKNEKGWASEQLSHMAIMLQKQGEYEKAMNYYQRALTYNRKMNDLAKIAGLLNNIANLHMQIRQPKEANKALVECLEIAKKLDNPDLMLNTLCNVGWNHFDLKEMALAENYFRQALAKLGETKNKELICTVQANISDFFELTGKYKEALQIYKEFIVTRDTVYSIVSAAEVMGAEMSHEFEKKKAATKFRSDKVVYELEHKNKRAFLVGLFLVIFLALAVILLLVGKRAYNTKKRLAQFLIEEDQRKELLLQEVHHRINNNLQIISALLSLQANSVQDERLNEYLQQSQNRIQSLAALHEMMYDTNNPLQVNLSEYLEKILNFHKEVLSSTPGIMLEATIPSVEFPTKRVVPIGLIVNELVTNSIKYAFEGKDTGTISVSLSRDASNEWTLIVSDNGKGLPPDSERRTESLGLALVGMLVKQLAAELVSVNDNGAVFRLKFAE